MSRRHAWPVAAETGTVDAAPAPEAAPAAERLALRLDEVAAALGVSRRAIERERAAGRFPRPDLTIGRMPLWKPETIKAWLEGGGA
jgi:predicted DNA-binding transcriptional regulator AlpA